MMISNTNNTMNLAMNALTATNNSLEKTARALSTGLKAATAADDAAGFARGIGISVQAAGVDRAIRNSQDGISLLQTAEGGLSQINSTLQRMRDLSVQAANDSLTAQDRSYIQTEIEELRKNIDGAVSSTTFNGKRLLDGSSTAQWSSDSASTKLKVSGAITAIDSYSQRKLTEGNYKIEVRAKPGQNQIQKSNIIELDYIDETPLTEKTYKRDKDGNFVLDDKSEKIEITVTVAEKKLYPAKLENIKSFRNASGVSYFTEPQVIRITQGDGKTADVVVDGGDTVDDVRKKINDAIADDLGQSEYTDSREHFCTISDGTQGTSESVFSEEDVMIYTYQRDSDGNILLDEYDCPIEEKSEMKIRMGTLVIRSAVAGKAGELTFSSDNEDLINALGLQTIQQAEDNQFTASVFDAHSGKILAKNVPTNGNVLQGVIHPNADVEFDSMANVKAAWDEGSKRYVLTSEAAAYETTLHIQDRSTAFQIGQRTGEDIFINIGDMRSSSLGIDKVDVTTRENASRSLAILDAAIHKVSTQRSRLGAYQNELEYNTESLTQTSLQLQASESRIKDADMALEYMEFVKFQILNQTGSSMLTQANQNGQDIMRALNL